MQVPYDPRNCPAKSQKNFWRSKMFSRHYRCRADLVTEFQWPKLEAQAYKQAGFIKRFH